jgi:NADH dehydrogenase [ubiquinone] 1 alpha subcomplex assembly factor 1
VASSGLPPCGLPGAWTATIIGAVGGATAWRQSRRLRPGDAHEHVTHGIRCDHNGNVFHMLFDFADPNAVSGWSAIDDRVMGGVSRSRLAHHSAGHAVFTGVVSLEHNGGFASVRSSPGTLGHPDATEVVIQVRGSDRVVKIGLFSEDGWDRMSHQASFSVRVDSGPVNVATAAGPWSMSAATGCQSAQPAALKLWQTICVPLARFEARFRGRRVAGADAIAPASIRQVGLMVADRQAGPFEIQIRSIGLA